MANSIEISSPQNSQYQDIMEVLESRNFHHIGTAEMPSFPLSDCLVALVDGTVRGVAGWRILSKTTAKTTLLAVHPDWAYLGLGRKLQSARLQFLRKHNIKSVTTNTDDVRVIRWLVKRHGFKPTGETVDKVNDFGNPQVKFWTTLKLSLIHI